MAIPIPATVAKRHRLPWTCAGHASRATPFALALAGLCLFAAPAQATYPGRNGRILFDKVGDRQLFTVSPDGTGAKKLTHEHGQNHRDASYSADGRRIVYVRGRAAFASIATVRADGTHNRVVADRVGVDPVFSPSGRTIAFDTGSRIFSVGSAGLTLRQLTPGFPASNWAPTYSPDGSQIVFSCVANGMYQGLCSMAPDGSGLHPIFSSPTESPAAPDFAPKGGKVAVLLGVRGRDAIATIGLAHSNVHVIRRFDPAGRHPIGEPVFSPDGERIAMTIAPNASSLDTDVYVMRADGSHLRRLTHTPGTEKSSRLDDWRPLPRRQNP
jgi:TolB protein